MTLAHNWLDDGGWYLLLPERLVPSWSGINDDYDRFCEVAGHWLSPLPVAGGFGLVLGGDPAMALVWPRSDNSTLLIRWHYAECEKALIALALEGGHIRQTEPDTVFKNSDPIWWLFNAAADPSTDHPTSRVVQMPTGRVRMSTAFLKHDDNACIVHAIRHDE